MAEHKRTSAETTKGAKLGTGIFSARVINNIDPTYMGSLEVTLMKPQGNQVANPSQSFIVRYAPPFYGYTTFENMGLNAEGDLAYDDTQKSYGMWFVPPDIGVSVLVASVDGDAAQGYWFASVPSRFTNNMVPGIAASNMHTDKANKYDAPLLPVAEINKRANGNTKPASAGKGKPASKPGDSAEPNPNKIKKAVHPIAGHMLNQGLLLDKTRGVITSSARRESPSTVFGISTPGPVDPAGKKAPRGTTEGTTVSKTEAPVLVSRLGGSQFVMDDGDNTMQRTKHASKGKMEYKDISKTGVYFDPKSIPEGECFRLRTRTGHQILMHNSEDLIYIGNSRGTTWIELTSNGKIDIFAQDSISIHTQVDLNIRADRDLNLEAGRNVNMKAAGRIQIESKGNTNLLVAKNFKLTAKLVQLNPSTPVNPLPTMSVPTTDGTTQWKGNHYKAKGQLDSIMKRVPMHEPWTGHENLDPVAVTPAKTDREV